ncbi:MAG: SufD family Fe-S cluster assembly protein [Candidatus Micrarchaeota archaeon]
MEKILKNEFKQQILQLSKNANEPEWLIDHRTTAFGTFETLPVEKNEPFRKYADIDSIEWARMAQPKIEGSEKGIPQLDNAPKNIIFTSIAKAIAAYPDIVRPYFDGKVTKPTESKFAALASAAFTLGYFIRIPKNTALARPIRLSNAIAAPNSLMAHRNIVILEENSSATIIEENTTHLPKGKGSIFVSATDFDVHEGANLRFGSINSLDSDSIHISHKKALLGKDAKTNFSGGFLGGALTTSSLENVMEGSGSSATDFEIIFGTHSQKFNITSDLTHIGKDTIGKVAAKGVFKDSSKGLFKGMVRIGKDAKNASSYLAGHSILLSKNASSDANPSLQIETNEVKATHSASVSQIDELQLFYLQSRGIHENEAKKMVVEGFMAPVIRQMHLWDVEITLKALFQLKWEGRDMSLLEAKKKEIESQMPEEPCRMRDTFEGHYKYR